MSVARILLATVLATSGVFLNSTESHAATIQVQQGVLEGTSKAGVDAYLGIPYAAPPVGSNRWRMPMPPRPWSGTRLATTFANSCQQTLSDGFGPWTSEYLASGPVSEDCLYLNIWKPSNASNARLPIMVWIHGGGFVSGSGSVPVYDGAPMAAKGVIVVNMNYRLGVFGFLAHPDLTRDGTGSGNYGLADIIAALKWVRDNAEALGGARDQITIAGQSAGSMAVHDLIASPAAKHLFARAISESGPGMGRLPTDLAAAETVGQQLLSAAGVTSIAQLRQLPAQEIIDAEARMTPHPGGLLRFAPVIDGWLLPDDPYSNAPGKYADTPILAGMNADEAFSLPHDDQAKLHAETAEIFGAMAPKARALYGTDQAINVRELNRTIRRERGLASTWLWAQGRAMSSRHPTYIYLFNHVEPGTEEWGVFHTSEVPYVLATLDRAPGRKFTDTDKRISAQASSYWINFIKTGNPNGEGLTHWSAYNVQSPSMMVLDAAPKMQPLLSPEKYRFYQEFVASGGRLTLF